MKISKKQVEKSFVNDILRKNFILGEKIIKRNTDKTLEYVESR